VSFFEDVLSYSSRLAFRLQEDDVEDFSEEFFVKFPKGMMTHEFIGRLKIEFCVIYFILYAITPGSQKVQLRAKVGGVYSTEFYPMIFQNSDKLCFDSSALLTKCSQNRTEFPGFVVYLKGKQILHPHSGNHEDEGHLVITIEMSSHW